MPKYTIKAKTLPWGSPRYPVDYGVLADVQAQRPDMTWETREEAEALTKDMVGEVDLRYAKRLAAQRGKDAEVKPEEKLGATDMFVVVEVGGGPAPGSLEDAIRVADRMHDRLSGVNDVIDGVPSTVGADL